MGTPELAARALESIIDGGHEVPLVLTQPDRPKGRGKKLGASPVKELALARGIEVFQPLKLKEDGVLEKISAARPDVIVVAAYGLLVPATILELPQFGCLNIHTSILPRWRGAAPIQRAVQAGDKETGVTIMQMDKGLDTGDILLEKKVPIAADETGGTLHDKLMEEGASLILDALANLENLKGRKQSEEGATYASKISKEECAIDWNLPSVAIDRNVRAFNPFPGCFTFMEGARLKVHRTSLESPLLNGAEMAELAKDVPGSIRSFGGKALAVKTGDGIIFLDEVQAEGSRRMGFKDYLAGRSVKEGLVLGEAHGGDAVGSGS